MDEKCNSADLAIALNGNTKIIATTIQKFPYIVDSVQGLKNKHFAVIIDEAHSSTAGKDMAAVTPLSIYPKKKNLWAILSKMRLPAVESNPMFP